MPEPVEILLVEDNPDDVELTLRTFRKYNVSSKIMVVEDGVEALNFLHRRGTYANRDECLPKLVLLDLKLPRVSGIEVLTDLKSDPVLRALPVVVLTSSRESRDIDRCYALGVNSYIVKPVDFVQFGEAVRHLGLYWLLLNQTPRTTSQNEELKRERRPESSVR